MFFFSEIPSDDRWLDRIAQSAMEAVWQRQQTVPVGMQSTRDALCNTSKVNLFQTHETIIVLACPTLQTDIQRITTGSHATL